jgi:hypothetical protein
LQIELFVLIGRHQFLEQRLIFVRGAHRDDVALRVIRPALKGDGIPSRQQVRLERVVGMDYRGIQIRQSARQLGCSAECPRQGGAR